MITTTIVPGKEAIAAMTTIADTGERRLATTTTALVRNPADLAIQILVPLPSSTTLLPRTPHHPRLSRRVMSPQTMGVCPLWSYMPSGSSH